MGPIEPMTNSAKESITGCNNIEFLASHTNPVFHRGVFYYLVEMGIWLLLTLNTVPWTMLNKPEKSCTEIRRNYLVDCDGDLIFVFEGCGDCNRNLQDGLLRDGLVKSNKFRR